MKRFQSILVTGGAGYVGAVLVPRLIHAGYRVKVIDLYLYGDVLASVKGRPNLTEVKGDVRDRALLEREIPGTDALIHLACVSNDPCFDLDPALAKTINYNAFRPLVEIAKKNKVKRFIFASSSSVYGVKTESEVTEDLPREPLTDYSKYKALCEDILLEEAADDFNVVVVRPSTVCGWSPRMRLDLAVNILTSQAIINREINVLGGEQKRPNIHIEDMVDLYLFMLEQPDEKIHKKIFNVGCQNRTIREIAEIVTKTVGGDISVKVSPNNDNRSYHVSSEKIRRELGFEAKRTIEEAVREMQQAFADGKIPDAMTDIRYYNIKTMQHLKLK